MKILAYTRQLVLKALVRWNPGDVSITHHHTGDRFRIHSFRHRGYWFKRDKREKTTIDRFSQLLNVGNVVVELGGYIGYLAVIFAKAVGSDGKVIVFEPGLDNLNYLRQNTSCYKQVEIVEAAVCESIGTATFYEESLSGQNNSLIQDYDVLKTNVNRSGLGCEVIPRVVPTTTLDQFVAERKIVPTLIKIDIEGAEYFALKGASDVLKSCRPVLMVEITNNTRDVVELLWAHNYRLFPEITGELTKESPIPERLWNTFAVPVEDEQHIQMFVKSNHSK